MQTETIASIFAEAPDLSWSYRTGTCGVATIGDDELRSTTSST